MKNFTSYLKTWLLIPIGLLVMATIGIGTASSGCRVYKFRVYALPDTIKTVKINFFDNKARYVNPQLSPRLTDRLRQKIVSQTRLSQTNNDNADWEISGYISDYSLSTSAISFFFTTSTCISSFNNCSIQSGLGMNSESFSSC